MKQSRFIYSSIIMVIMNFLIRIIGFSYDISLSRLLGAEAMGLFQIAMSTMMTFLIITTGGVPTSVSKLVAEQNSRKNHGNIESIYKVAIIFNFILSIILSLILIIFAEIISIKIFKNKEMIIGIYLLIPAIIIHSLSSVLKSYFYGMRNVMTPSISQVIEHGTRFIFVIGVLYTISPLGPVYGAIIAILGISVGEFFDLIWSIYSRRRLNNNNKNKIKGKENKKLFLGRLLYMAIPLTLSGFLGVILRFSNTILIPNRLMVSGYSSSDSIAIFGRITGMTMPLIHLPFVVTSALVINLIPSLSEQVQLKRHEEIKSDIELALKVTFLISIPLTFIYVTLSKPLAKLLYNDIVVAEFIHIMGYGTLLLALRHTFSGILYGINKQINATINRLIGMILQVLLVYFLVGNPRFGIYGYFISFFASLIISLILDIFSLRMGINYKLDYWDIIGKPVLASCAMIGFIYISTYDILYIHNLDSIVFLYSLLVGSFTYILVLVFTGAIPKNLIQRIVVGLRK